MSHHAQAVDESLLSGTGNQPQKEGGVYVRFYLEAVENKLKSWGGTRVRPDGTEEVVEGAGRPIYDEVEFIEVRVPGDKTNIVQRPVRPEDKRQYAAAYAAWKAGDKEQLTGTPLAVWPGATRAQVAELLHFGIRTVEQLAQLSDGNMQNVGPIRALRQRAQDYLTAAEGMAPLETLRSQVAERDNRIQSLEAQVKALAEASKKSGKQ